VFCTIDIEARVRPDYPLRPIKAAVDRILTGCPTGSTPPTAPPVGPGVPPERPVKALMLVALSSVRSERQLAARIDTDFLFRWFLAMSPRSRTSTPRPSPTTGRGGTRTG
jgi:transposase